MYTIVANGDNISSGINFYLVDTKEQLNNLYPRPGSKAYVVEDSKTYILTHRKGAGRWVEHKPVLAGYVDEAINAALNNFQGNVTDERLQQLIIDILPEYDWSKDSAFKTEVNSLIARYLDQSSYVTKSEMDAAIAEAVSGTIAPDLKDYLTKQEAAATYLTQTAARNQFVATADFEPDLIYVAGATIQDIK